MTSRIGSFCIVEITNIREAKVFENAPIRAMGGRVEEFFQQNILLATVIHRSLRLEMVKVHLESGKVRDNWFVLVDDVMTRLGL